MTILTTLLGFLLSVGLALADVGADLTLAADPDLAEPARRAAFDRLVRGGATDVNALIEAARTGEDTRRRWVAIRVLGHVGGPLSHQTLIVLLEDPEPAIRTAALGALGDTGDAAFAPRVIESLADPAVIVRAAAAEALGKLRDPRAIGPLAAALDSPDSYFRGSSLWVRQHYVITLGIIGDVRALPTLLRAMDDRDPEVARLALLALEQIGGFSLADGRSPEEERQAWQRWATAQIQARNLR